MADLTGVTKYFATANETGNLSLTSTTSGGAATVPVTNLGSYYSNGDIVALAVEPGTASQQVFTGEVSGSNVINAVWTEGSDVSHAGGSSIKDLRSATHQAALAKGLKEEHKDTGAHGDITADSATVSGATQTDSLQVDNNATVGGTLGVTGAFTENGATATTIRSELVPFDFVASGGVVAQTAGLTGSFSNIVAYIGGSRTIKNSEANHAYTASKDTYVDFGNDGVVDYNEVANGAASPALSASHIRVAKVVTSGAAITSVTQSFFDSLGNAICRRNPSGSILGKTERTTAYNLTTTDTEVMKNVFIVPTGGRMVEVMFNLGFAENLDSASGFPSATLWEGEVTSGTQRKYVEYDPGNSSELKAILGNNSWLGWLAAGTYTYRVSAKQTSTADAFLTASSTNPMFLTARIV